LRATAIKNEDQLQKFTIVITGLGSLQMLGAEQHNLFLGAEK